MPINCDGAKELKYLRLTNQFCRPASSTLNYMSVRRDDAIGDEKSTTYAQWLTIRVVHS
jgi:hypothetical protein